MCGRVESVRRKVFFIYFFIFGRLRVPSSRLMYMLWQGDFSILLGTEFRSLLLMYCTLYYPACSSSLGLALLFGYRNLDPRSRARTTPEAGFGEVLFSVKVLGKKILWPFLRPPKACQLLPPCFEIFFSQSLFR